MKQPFPLLWLVVGGCVSLVYSQGIAAPEQEGGGGAVQAIAEGVQSAPLPEPTPIPPDQLQSILDAVNPSVPSGMTDFGPPPTPTFRSPEKAVVPSGEAVSRLPEPTPVPAVAETPKPVKATPTPQAVEKLTPVPTPSLTPVTPPEAVPIPLATPAMSPESISSEGKSMPQAVVPPVEMPVADAAASSPVPQGVAGEGEKAGATPVPASRMAIPYPNQPSEASLGGHSEPAAGESHSEPSVDAHASSASDLHGGAGVAGGHGGEKNAGHGTGEPAIPAWEKAEKKRKETFERRENEANRRVEVAHQQALLATKRNSPEVVNESFKKLLEMNMSSKKQSVVLADYGNYLESIHENPVKVAAVYEQSLLLDTNTIRTPVLNLKLGKIYQELGANKRSMDKYYAVLSSSLRAETEAVGADLSRQAMKEIANAFFEMGEYRQAAQYYSRIKLLDLPPEERAFVLSRVVEILYRQKEYAAAVEAGREFLKQFPNSEQSPACRQIVIQSLDASGKRDDAIQETLGLLQATQKSGGAPDDKSLYWKMKTGNDLANILYSRGEYLRAVNIYQTIAGINRHPLWVSPTVYQIGLCFERLQQPKRALEAYRYVVANALPAPKDGEEIEVPQRENLEHLRDLAEWRAKHLEWLIETAVTVHPILVKGGSGERNRESPKEK